MNNIQIQRRHHYISLYNLLLPFVLIVAFLLRINLTSFAYLIFCLLIPTIISSPLSRSPSHPKRFLFCLTIWSALCFILQIFFNGLPRLWLKSTLLFLGGAQRRPWLYRKLANECYHFIGILNQIGLKQVKLLDANGNIYIQPMFATFAPDFIVLLTSAMLYYRIKLLNLPLLRKYFRKVGISGELSDSIVDMNYAYFRKCNWLYSQTFNDVLFCTFSCITGCIYPCLLTAPYFLIFLLLATSFAFRRRLNAATWYSLRRFTHFALIFHISVLYIYQLPNVNRFLPRYGFLARFFGLIQYASDPCNNKKVVSPITSWVWPETLLPVLLFLLHWLVATQLNIEKEFSEFIKPSRLSLSRRNVHRSAERYLLMENEEHEKKPDVPNQLTWMDKFWTRIRLKLISVYVLLHNNIYIFCLLIMMVWSLLYHSWSTFVLLITACLVWMHPNTHQIFYRLIPFLSGYAEVLLFTNFIYAFPLTQSEFPDENPVFLRQIGLEKPRNNAPFVDLMIKTFFNLVFWTALYRRFCVANAENLPQILRKGTVVSTDLEAVVVVVERQQKKSRQETLIEKFSILARTFLLNFWFLFVLAMVLAISSQNPVAFYRIVYMALFLIFVNLFHISFRTWRRFMYTFWMIIIAYCLFLLTLLYTYQFHGIPELYLERLGLTEDITRSLGLERFSSSALFFQLLTPISFLIFSLIQVNYGHERIMKITENWEEEAYGLKLRFLMSKLKLFHRQTNYLEGALGMFSTQNEVSVESESRPAPSKQVELMLPSKEQMRLVITRLEEKCKRVLKHRQSIWNISWRLIEIHFNKIIAFYSVYVALNEVSIFNFLLHVSAGGLIFAEQFSTEIINFSSILSSSVVIFKMLYQLEFIKEEQISNVCWDNVTSANVTVTLGDWFGLYKSDSIFQSTQHHIFLVLLIATKTIIYIRQFMHRKAEKLAEPPYGILFPGIDRKMADIDTFHCILYFANYFFYRFGVEICLIVTVVTVGYRNDYFSVLYASSLIFLLLLDRTEKNRIWPYYLTILYGLFAYQYLLCLGVPIYFCWSYFWDEFNKKMIEWLYLPSFYSRPNPYKLFADFVQLVCVSCQMRVFKLENLHGSSYPGGSNKLKTIMKTRQFLLSFNLRFLKIAPDKFLKDDSVPDFISESKTLLDKLKEIFFMYFYWISLSVVFIAGTTCVTIFSVGYLFASFIFLWKGNSLFLKATIVAIKLWDLLILYNVVVIFLKVLLQLFGIACNNISSSNVIYVLLRKLFTEKEFSNILAECDIPHRESGIFYDGLCFTFLLIQRRVFTSEYFKHVIIELNAQKFFASRGAELISLIRRQEELEAAENERAMVNKVKTKMNNIRTKHDKEALQPLEEVVEITPTTPINTNFGNDTSEGIPTQPSTHLHQFGQPLASNFLNQFQLKTNLSHLRMRKISAPNILTQQAKNRKMFSKIPSVVEESDSDEPLSVGLVDKLAPARKNSGVKGLGPLQLLNFAFKKGALGDAVKESNEIEATHDLLERQMEETYGISDYQSIRRAILKQKALQKAKADYDEDTFDEDAEPFIPEFARSPFFGLSKMRTKSVTIPALSADQRRQLCSSQEMLLENDKIKKFTLPKLVIERVAVDNSGNVEDVIFDDYEEQNIYESVDEKFTTQIRVQSRTDKLRLKYYEEMHSIAEPQYFSINSKHNLNPSLLAKIYVKEFLRNLCLFLFMFIQGVIESLIGYLMRLSRDYRYITYILREEKRVYKEYMQKTIKHNETQHMSRADRKQRREIINQTIQETKIKSGVLKEESFQKLHRCLTARRKTEMASGLSNSENTSSVPANTKNRRSSYSDFERTAAGKLGESDNFLRTKASLSPTSTICANEHLGGTDTLNVRGAFSDSELPMKLDNKERTTEPQISNIPVKQDTVILKPSTSLREEEESHLLSRLIVSIYYSVLSRSETICYLMLVLNHIFTANLLSMPLPLMMLLWGTLTVPRSSKRFWIILITYTEVMVVIKYIFQFGFFPWVKGAPSLDPFWPPRIIGIEKRPMYAAWDLALLMALFLHRNILMSIGLWKNEPELEAEEEKNEERNRINQLSDDIELNTMNKSENHARHFMENPLDYLSRRRTVIMALARHRSFRVQSIAGIVSDLNISKSKFKNRVQQRVGRMRNFFGVLLDEYALPIDVYTPMFICDAICFLIVIFGYSSFGTDQGAGSVTAYFQENKVPGTLVAMLIIQFILMVIDRALFLRKYLFGKLVFQIFLIIFVHIWMFLLLPGATGRLFAKNFACQLWYFVKIIYFLISAKQICAGYPKHQLGNAISNTYSAIHLLLYKIYLGIPFLYELSLLMDWMWIDTCLGLSNWITLHDIYSSVSMIKCERNIEEDYPSPKGVKKGALAKYGRGGFLLFLIILIIWFPLVLFSMANTVGTRSVPVECTAKLTISGYQPLFESTARLGDIRSLTIDEYNDLYYTYRTSKTALSFIADYDNEDVVIAQIDGNSSSRWQISPPSRISLINSLNSSKLMSIQFDWQFKRAPDENLQYGSVENFHTIELHAESAIRTQLINVIMGVNKTKILLPNLFPSMVEVPGEGKADSANSLLTEHLRGGHEPLENTFTDVLLELDNENGVEWWKLRMIDPLFDPIRISDPIIRDKIVFYGFVDKKVVTNTNPKSINKSVKWRFPEKCKKKTQNIIKCFITGGGILGLYVSIVLVLGHYVRGIVTDSMKKVMFEELPNVDRLLQLCHDIFLVRDANEFELEEDLFAKLIFIFRSPATLIKWTREKMPPDKNAINYT